MNTFPLLRLPEKARQNVIQVMEPSQFLLISTLSNTAKKLVKSLDLKCEHSSFNLDIRSESWFSVFFNSLRTLRFSKNGGENNGSVLMLGSESYPGVPYESILVENSNFVWKDWIRHTMDVFNCNRIFCIVFRSEFDLNAVQRTFKGFEIDEVDLSSWISEDFKRKILKYLPPSERLRIDSTLPDDEFSKFAIQNFKHFKTERQIMRLNILLSSNCVYFQSFDSIFSPKDLNRFIKLWMAGATNSQIERFSIEYQSNSRDLKVDEVIVLKGIKYQNQREERVYVDSNYNMNICVNGMLEIVRKDGVVATIQLSGSNPFLFEMFIWH